MTHTTIKNLTGILNEARAAGDAALVAHVEPMLEKAEALVAQIETGAPVDAALQQEFAEVSQELIEARDQMNRGTRDPEKALENAARVTVLDARRRVVDAERQQASAAVKSPEAALQKLGVIRERAEARRSTLGLLDRVINPLAGSCDGFSYTQLQAAEQAGQSSPGAVLWWAAAEREALAELADRRKKAARRDAVFYVTDEQLKEIFEFRRRALETRRRKLLEAARTAATEADRLAEAHAPAESGP